MRHYAWTRRPPAAALGMAVILWGVLAANLPATELILKDGRALRGRLGRVAGLAESPLANMTEDGPPIQSILMLDDNLRRTFFSERLLAPDGVRVEEKRPTEEKFQIWQRVLRTGATVKIVGTAVRVEPFDEFGRRTYTMNSPHGPMPVFQGITELTPQWTRVEGLSHVWDMRLSTDSIPRDILRKILFKQVDPKNPEDYKRIARFCLQGERYEEARQTLDALVAAFPEQKEDVVSSIRLIRQMSARQLLSELKMRRDAGQHRLVRDKLERFPSEDVGGEILQGVREMIQEYDAGELRRQTIVERLRDLVGRLSDTPLREGLQPAIEEIAAELGVDTLDRMAPFMLHGEDAEGSEKLSDAQRLALAVTGWLLGPDAAGPDLSAAVAAHRARRLIRQYLNEDDRLRREKTFETLREESRVDASMAANLLARMKPPIAPPPPVEGKPGYYAVETVGMTRDEKTIYRVQLPPEYNPYRLYPTIVALHGGGYSADLQLDWWAGAWDGESRAGQAARQGYIVVAPEWTAEHQQRYEYSAREHAAVLNALRDACRRFAVDTDRVYLTGHGLGGDAAWDIGLAHPDLWAGVIPISAVSDRFSARYWENARYVPFYVVLGELDGGRLAQNAGPGNLDRYVKRGFNTTVVEFLGRGNEDYYDEILRLFDWMGRFRRDFFPREFACCTMRRWDNFFWWLEVDGMPPRAMVEPADWPPPSGTLPIKIEGTINNTNGIVVRAGASRVTVWLSPKMIDFQSRSVITVNGQRISGPNQMIRPDLRTMLEDVRLRGDRQHPFWARLDAPAGR